MKKNILIVEDDTELCDEISEVLEASGYNVNSVHDKEGADRILKEKDYDILLLDIKIHRRK